MSFPADDPERVYREEIGSTTERFSGFIMHGNARVLMFRRAPIRRGIVRGGFHQPRRPGAHSLCHGHVNRRSAQREARKGPAPDIFGIEV
jgi:hypothetical protein